MMKTVVLGYGAIGRKVADSLRAGTVAGVELIGVHTRTPGAAGDAGFRELTEAEMLEEADLVVECAGVGAARSLGPAVVSAGKDLLLVSAGVLADAALRETLLAGGPGRTFVTSGAIGGLDILAAAAVEGGLTSASLTTSKSPRSLVQPEMSEQEAQELRETTVAVTVFSGNVKEAIERFPSSLNIAVALAHATGLWDETRVNLVADPAVARTEHEIRAEGAVGSYTFMIENHVSPDNPATSAVTALAAIKGVRAIAGRSGTVV